MTADELTISGITVRRLLPDGWYEIDDPDGKADPLTFSFEQMRNLVHNVGPAVLYSDPRR